VIKGRARRYRPAAHAFDDFRENAVEENLKN
jgi:hypothetical protein